MPRPPIRTLAALAAFALLLPAAALAQTTRPDDVRLNPDDPAVRQVHSLLAAGKIADALKLTDERRTAAPADAAARALYVQLRMSIVRQALADQQFNEAEVLLRQVLSVTPDDANVARMVATIEAARGRLNASLADARQLLRVERFEQAAALLRQAAGLVPDQPQLWRDDWFAALMGAADDHYIMQNYGSALSFYTQAIDLRAAPGQPGQPRADAAALGEQVLWRWCHCYAMNLAYTAAIQRSPQQWQGILDQIKPNFEAARAVILGKFVTALGRENLGQLPESIALYRELLGGRAPADDASRTPAQTAAVLRAAATDYVDTLSRADTIERRGGAWATVLPGAAVQRNGRWVNVEAHNDLAARRIVETVDYHAPRLVAYLGGAQADLDWKMPYTIALEPKMGGGSLTDLGIPSYTIIDTRGNKLVAHKSVCYQTDPLLLGATIPHELSHALIHRLAAYADVPLAIDEGLAIHAETTARYVMFRRELVRRGGPQLTVAQLLSADKMPPAGRAAFYAECYNLVAWLISRGGGPPRVVAMCRLTAQMPPVAALLKAYNFPDLASAEASYHAFLVAQGLLAPPQTPSP
ncbi:MAG: hypothetical protein BIFFINMI_01157 [Phycisphaerae bacterium]|nr:hypothetical protein [Phycisphaerae bacterium]